jgi:predicted Rdx family selenoprotein
VESEIKAAFPNARIRLIEGGGGVFDIRIDEHLIYSKKKEGFREFPSFELVNERITKHLSS